MKFKLKQIKSAIGTTQKQKANLRSLKLGKIGKISFFDESKSFLGRLEIVKHLLLVKKVDEKKEIV